MREILHISLIYAATLRNRKNLLSVFKPLSIFKPERALCSRHVTTEFLLNENSMVVNRRTRVVLYPASLTQQMSSAQVSLSLSA
jgi:hypothetical protein